jgi:hypothetical protein
MFRIAISLLILSVLANGVDAAVDIADVFVSHASGNHDAHDPHQGDSGADGEGADDATQHFCHCAAHMPPLGADTQVDFPPLRVAAPDDVANLAFRSRFPPPVRPPKR